jgi:hypothetical protein
MAGTVAGRTVRVQSTEATPQITIRAASGGAPYLNLASARARVQQRNYRGEPDVVSALTGGAAVPRALSSADVDRNGTPDVIAGYALNGAGVITIQRG